MSSGATISITIVRYKQWCNNFNNNSALQAVVQQARRSNCGNLTISHPFRVWKQIKMTKTEPWQGRQCGDVILSIKFSGVFIVLLLPVNSRT